MTKKIDISYSQAKKLVEESPVFKQGVKFPNKGTLKAYTIMLFIQYEGEVITKQEATKIVNNETGKVTNDLQELRHLGKQQGFNIIQGGEIHEGRKLKRGCYVLKNLTECNPYWNKNRRGTDNLNWDAKKKYYDYCCATCGAKEGNLHKNTQRLIILEQGHMDPKKEMNNDNIIPQCQECNRFYKNNYKFDKFGRHKGMTNEGIIKEHSDEQLKELYKVLSDKYYDD